MQPAVVVLPLLIQLVLVERARRKHYRNHQVMLSWNKELSQCGKPVLLSLVPGYSEAYVPASTTGSLPLPLTEVFQKDMLESSYPEVLKVCSAVFDTYSGRDGRLSPLTVDISFSTAHSSFNTAHSSFNTVDSSLTPSIAV